MIQIWIYYQRPIEAVHCIIQKKETNAVIQIIWERNEPCMNMIWLCFRYSGMESWGVEGRKEKRQERVKTDFVIKPKKKIYLQPAIYIHFVSNDA